MSPHFDDMIMQAILDSVRNETGQLKLQCPRCTSSRNKTSRNDLSVNVEEGTYYCWHCGLAGRVGGLSHESDRLTLERPVKRPRKALNVITDKQDDLGIESEKFLIGRGLTEKETWSFCRLREKVKWIYSTKELSPCICFNYYIDGNKLVNVKYRDTQSKSFLQVSGGYRCLWLIDHARTFPTAIITEGELDAMSWIQAGHFAMSIPDGALNPNAANVDIKMRFWKNSLPYLHGKRLYLNMDGDAPGKKMEQVIKDMSKGCDVSIYCIHLGHYKDANEALQAEGSAYLTHALQNNIY